MNRFVTASSSLLFVLSSCVCFLSGLFVCSASSCLLPRYLIMSLRCYFYRLFVCVCFFVLCVCVLFVSLFFKCVRSRPDHDVIVVCLFVLFVSLLCYLPILFLLGNLRCSVCGLAINSFCRVCASLFVTLTRVDYARALLIIVRADCGKIRRLLVLFFMQTS